MCGWQNRKHLYKMVSLLISEELEQYLENVVFKLTDWQLRPMLDKSRTAWSGSALPVDSLNSYENKTVKNSNLGHSRIVQTIFISAQDVDLQGYNLMQIWGQLCVIWCIAQKMINIVPRIIKRYVIKCICLHIHETLYIWPGCFYFATTGTYTRCMIRICRQNGKIYCHTNRQTLLFNTG